MSLGHGRIEERALHAFPVEADALAFPYARSLIVVRSTRTIKATGHTSSENRYYLSSLESDERTPAQWQALIRGHWAGVEIRNHWRRDALWGEDHSRTRNNNALANIALVRDALLALLPEHYPEHSLPEIKELCHSRPATCLRIIRST